MNGIEYRDSKDREQLLNLVELNKTKSKDGQPRTTRFIWVNDLEITKDNVREIAQTAGRDRWKIENQVRIAGSLFKKYFPRGFGSLKNFAERLREAWRNSLLHEQVLGLLDQLRFQSRFDTS